MPPARKAAPSPLSGLRPDRGHGARRWLGRPGHGRLSLRVTAAAAVGAAALTGAACSAPGSAGGSAPAVSPSTGAARTTPAPTASSTTSVPRSAGSAATAAGPESCAGTIADGLTAAQQAGQLLMVGLDTNAGTTSLDRLVKGRHLGGVILLGGWYDGAADVRRATGHLAGLARGGSPGLGLLLAADQEGGAVQQLRGAGFTRYPSARVLGATSVKNVTAAATTKARQLKAAGINLNLAPVSDTVPSEIGRSNAPIGRWGREYSDDPDTVGTMVAAFVKGMEAGGVASTIKHFPGLGRITGNTDLTASGITDHTATVSDPHLEPFATGIAAGADLVMVGSAIYSRLDPGTHAVFSKAIVTDLLRDRLGYDGVVITDDVGAAKAVAAVPPAERATRFIAAGGDIVLTARPATVAPMHEAITARMAADAAFAKQVEAAVTRVVELKLDMGLARCP